MSHNTWIHRGVRVLVRPLARTPVTPNQVTGLRLLTGLAAAVALAVGDEGWRSIGAGLFVVSMVLDRADGELARLTGKMSEWGHRFDLVGDALVNSLVFVGIGIGLRDSGLGIGAVPLGIVAGIAVAVVLWLMVRVERWQGLRAAELPPAGGFDADDALLAVPLALWLGFAEPLLIAAAVGASLFAVAFYWHHRRRLALARRR